MKANLENVFRLPTFRELYYPDQGWIRGNPDLDPERGVNVDFGFGINLSRMFFEAAGFHNDVKDTILWLPVSPFTIQPVNTGNVDIWGAEVDWEARPWDFLSLMVNYLYLDAEVEETGGQMPGRPRPHGECEGILRGPLRRHLCGTPVHERHPGDGKRGCDPRLANRCRPRGAPESSGPAGSGTMEVDRVPFSRAGCEQCGRCLGQRCSRPTASGPGFLRYDPGKLLKEKAFLQDMNDPSWRILRAKRSNPPASRKEAAKVAVR